MYQDTSIWSSDHRVKQYEQLPQNSLDVLFLGSSNIMSGINPLQLWNDTGIQSYAFSTRAQTFAFSYAFLQDALKTQSPKCIVLDAFSVLTSKPINGLINNDFHMSVNMDLLTMSTKTELLLNYVPYNEWIFYYFPLFKNHNFYKQTEEIPLETDRIFMGYCFEDTVRPYDTPQYSNLVTALDEVDSLYLEKIVRLCQQENIELIVIKTPFSLEDKSHQKVNAVKEFCELHNVAFYDMSLDAEHWGFDFETDMMDDIHLNSSGAEKATARMGDLLTEKYDFKVSANHQYANIWKQEFDRMVLFRQQMLTDSGSN